MAVHVSQQLGVQDTELLCSHSDEAHEADEEPLYEEEIHDGYTPPPVHTSALASLQSPHLHSIFLRGYFSDQRALECLCASFARSASHL